VVSRPGGGTGRGSPAPLSEAGQRLHRPGHVEQDGIGVEFHGQLDATVSHGGHGGAGVDAGGGEMGAEGVAEGVAGEGHLGQTRARPRDRWSRISPTDADGTYRSCLIVRTVRSAGFAANSPARAPGSAAQASISVERPLAACVSVGFIET